VIVDVVVVNHVNMIMLVITHVSLIKFQVLTVVIQLLQIVLVKLKKHRLLEEELTAMVASDDKVRAKIQEEVVEMNKEM